MNDKRTRKILDGLISDINFQNEIATDGDRFAHGVMRSISLAEYAIGGGEAPTWEVERVNPQNTVTNIRKWVARTTLQKWWRKYNKYIFLLLCCVPLATWIIALDVYIQTIQFLLMIASVLVFIMGMNKL